MSLIPAPAPAERDPRAAAVLDALPIRINLFEMLANAPALTGPALGLGSAILRDGDLDPVLRELVILAVAQRTGTTYEWTQHEPIALAVGVRSEQVAAVAAGAVEDPAFDEREQTVLALTAALLDGPGGTPPPELVLRADALLGRAPLVEVLLVTGYYAMLGGLMRAVDLDVDAPLDAAQLADAQRDR